MRILKTIYLLATIIAVTSLFCTPVIADNKGTPASTAPVTRVNLPLAGVIRPDQGTIEITVCPDRPQSEFGNFYDKIIALPVEKNADQYQNTFLSLTSPPASSGGIRMGMRLGKKAFGVADKNFAFTAGRPVNFAITWGRELTLWVDGKKIGAARLSESPDESLWPSQFDIGCQAPFDPRGLRISSVARDEKSLNANPNAPFAVDDDTTLVAGARLANVVLHTSSWQQRNAYAVAKPVWLYEEQCINVGQPGVFPIAIANHGTQPRTATLDLTLTPIGTEKATIVHQDIAIPAGTKSQIVRVPLPDLAAAYYQVKWRLSGAGLPELKGESAIAVFQRNSSPVDGALATFLGINTTGWPGQTVPFTRMGFRFTRGWHGGYTSGGNPFLWHIIEPLPGKFRWEEADEYVNNCQAGGMEMSVVLGFPSRWAAAEPSEAHKKLCPNAQSPCYWKPADLEAWARYVYAVAERYRGRIKAYEIWNEINFCPPSNHPVSFSGSTADYLKLQQIAYREIKRADPNAIVSSDGFSTCLQKSWVSDALRDGLAQYCDVFNTHGYNGVQGSADWVAEWHRQRPGAPVWMGEHSLYGLEDNNYKRLWLTAAEAIEFAAAGFQHFGFFLFDFSHIASPTIDLWVKGVLNEQLRPCVAFDASVEGNGANGLGIRHRFSRTDGSWLTVLGSEFGPMRTTLSAAPQKIYDLFGRQLECKVVGTSVVLDIPDLAYLISDKKISVLSADPLTDVPLLMNGDFELVPGDNSAGLAGKKPHGFKERFDKDAKGLVCMSDQPRSGKYAARLENTGTGDVRVVQEVKIPVAGIYKLECWFRCDKGTPVPFIKIFDQDKNKVYKSNLTPGVAGFRKLELEVNFTECNRKPTVVTCGITGAGTATIDDVTFTRVKPSFDHTRFRALDLSKAGNVPRMGWMKIMNIDKDFSRLVPGETVLAGRSWNINDGERALIALGDSASERAALPRRAEVMVGGKSAALCFLHTALWVKAKPGERLGRYLITYDDGTTAEEPLIHQRNIADWYPPSADPAVPLAISVDVNGGNCNLYTWRWVNPFPSKKIRNVAIEGLGNAIVLVAAISVENQ